jgi:hypothetical protein
MQPMRRLPQQVSWPKHTAMNTCGSCMTSSPITIGQAIKDMEHLSIEKLLKNMVYVNIIGKVGGFLTINPFFLMKKAIFNAITSVSTFYIFKFYQLVDKPNDVYQYLCQNCAACN